MSIHFRSLLALVTAGDMFSACSGGSTIVVSGTPPPSSVTPTNNAQQVSGSPIAHVIVVIMENRTPDNLFCQGNPLENNTPSRA